MVNDILSSIGSGQTATGIYRIIISGLVALLVASVGLLGWFVSDELSTWRGQMAILGNSVVAISNSVKGHVEADVQVRSATSQIESGVDVRVSRLEQHQDDVGKQIANAQQERLLQLQSLQQTLQQQSSTLIGVERELSVIEGRLDGNRPTQTPQ